MRDLAPTTAGSTASAVVLAADLPVVVLVAAGAVLGVSLLAGSTLPALGSIVVRRRSKRGRTEMMQATHRRVVTGARVALPSAAGPAQRPTTRSHVVTPPRQSPPPMDVPDRDDPSPAQAAIEELLDADPERVARLMMTWIRDDHGPEGAR